MNRGADGRQVHAAGGGAPARAEPAIERVLYVPDSVLVATWLAFQEGARLRVESTVRWAGPAPLSRAPHQVVTTVVNPVQRVSRGYFEVPHEGTRAMGEALVHHGLVNLAQVHTHPGRWVDHSEWDDDHAYSTREGALSLVWPCYGRELRPSEEWGVHERRGGAWVRLDSAAVVGRIIVVPGALNLRGPLEMLAESTEKDADSKEECEEGL